MTEDKMAEDNVEQVGSCWKEIGLGKERLDDVFQLVVECEERLGSVCKSKTKPEVATGEAKPAFEPALANAMDENNDKLLEIKSRLISLRNSVDI